MLLSPISSLHQHYEVFMSTKTKNWRPVKVQELIFHHEFDNDFDRFTVAGKTLLPGKLAPSVVGHVPRELSRDIWNAFRYVDIITAEVKDERPRRSPLVQGELEILIEMRIAVDEEDEES